VNLYDFFNNSISKDFDRDLSDNFYRYSSLDFNFFGDLLLNYNFYYFLFFDNFELPDKLNNGSLDNDLFDDFYLSYDRNFPEDLNNLQAWYFNCNYPFNDTRDLHNFLNDPGNGYNFLNNSLYLNDTGYFHNLLYDPIDKDCFYPYDFPLDDDWNWNLNTYLLDYLLPD